MNEISKQLEPIRTAHIVTGQTCRALVSPIRKSPIGKLPIGRSPIGKSLILKSMFGLLHLAMIPSVLVAQTSDAQQARSALETSTPKIDFRQQIQPLLARDCYACHGHDANSREADLRLDIEGAAKENAIVPGDIDSSELITRIFSDDPDEIMPPSETGHQLTPSEKKLIKQWIEQGASWQSHWAFEPIGNPKIPQSNSNWPPQRD